MKKIQKNLISRLSLLLLTTVSIVILASFSTPALNVPSSQVIGLQDEKAVLTGTNGEYVCKIVVHGTNAAAWSVLTDYDNYKNFMPNVVESRVLQSKKNQKVFEQTQTFKVLIKEVKGRVKMAMTETAPKQIKFKFIEGDLKSLDGSWQIQPKGANTFLITHQVSVQPKIKSPINLSLFYTVYEETLENTLNAVKQEIEKRSGIK